MRCAQRCWGKPQGPLCWSATAGSHIPVTGPGLLGLVFVRVRVVCGIYVICARCLRVSVLRELILVQEFTSRIALLLFLFASPLSRRLHQTN